MSKQCDSDHASSPTSQIHMHIDTTSMYTCSPSVLWEKRQNSCIWPPGYHIVWSPPASPVSSLTLVPLLLPCQGNWTFSVSDAPYRLLNGDFAVWSPSFPSFSFSLNPAYCSSLSLSVILLGSVLDFSNLIASFCFQVVVFIAHIVVVTLHVSGRLLMYPHFPPVHTLHNQCPDFRTPYLQFLVVLGTQ